MACRLQTSSAASLCTPPPTNRPLPHPVPAFSLFIYCIEDLRPQIDLWDWFGPPPPFLASTPPSPCLGLSLKRLLINPPTSSVSHREKRWVKKKDRQTQRDGERERESGSGRECDEGKRKNRGEMGCLYYPSVKLCDPFDKGSHFQIERGSKLFFFPLAEEISEKRERNWRE